MSGTDRAPEQRKEPGAGPRRGRSGSGQPRRSADSRPKGNVNARWPSTDQDNRNVGWVIISYLVAGMLIYGGLGWLVGHVIGTPRVAVLIGVLAGLALALVLVVLRYGRS